MNKPTIIFSLNKKLDKKICLEFLSIKAGGIDFGKGIIKTHPKFSGILKNKQPVRGRIIDSFVNNYYQDHQKEIKTVLLRTTTNWEKIDQKFYEKVETIFEGYRWPKAPYAGFLSIFNINPRFLENKSFQFFYLKSKTEILNTIAHEMLHFMFYGFLEKSIIPINYPEETVWQLSELFNTLILSQDEFKKLGVGSNICYPELLKHLPKIKKLWFGRKNLKEFLRKGLDYLNLN
ncbi:MAG: hypothetical protein UT91_C0037G0001 [Parcubacteria group bacterium GW2011_GWA2_40_23]|nr:MAG: hypothetical protein UT91_C0037G0001 [Parcubacteria group bacterium GW2011_GWA2_40_23]